jgi:N-acetylglucosaminyl-diphospho-decaprenol L-rhamnosyltransferase
MPHWSMHAPSWGLSLWRLRVLLTGKEDMIAPHLLEDSIRHSVFLAGFKVKDVQNPPLVWSGG